MTELSGAGAVGIQERYPLTPLQHGMLLQTLLAPALGVNVLQAVCRFREPLDADRLERAWRRVVARHDVLRTRFRWDDVPEPVQEVVAGVPVEIARHDGAGVPPAEREAALARYLAEDRARGFDLGQAPAMRLALFHGAGDDERVLVCSVHHVLLDAWSLTSVLGEVLALYDAGADGAEAALPALRPFGDHVRWLRERDAAADEAYWTGVFEGLEAPVPVLPIRSTPRDLRAEPRYGEREIRLAPAADAALRALRRDRGVFVNTVVQGAWALLLGRYTGRSEVVFGTVRNGRTGGAEGADGMVGMLINTVPLRVPLSPEARVVDWLREIGARSTSLAAHQHAALTDIQRWSGVPQGAPLFDTFVNYQPRPFDAPFRAVEGRGARLLDRPGYPLALNVDAEAPLRASIHYDADLFDAAAVDRMLGHFVRLLEEMAADPERPLGALDLLGQAERAVVLEEWSRTGAEYPADRCIHELVEAQAARAPEAVAVVFEGAELTYGELNARANRLAHHLRALGVGPDARVAIAVERGPEMVVGLLAILKAGGAYVPLDPAYPADRLRYMLADSAPAALLVQASLAASFAGVEVPTIVLDAGAAAWAGQPETNPERAALGPGHLAYVIYTSGSTGRPKGVLVEHGGLVSHTAWQIGAFGIGAGDTVLQRTSISFDASVWELWTTLAAGARMLLLPPDAEKDPGAIGRVIAEGGVTLAQFVPTLLQAVLGALPEGGSLPCRIVFCGGEPLPASLVDEALAAGAGEVVNLYGPTEATIQTTAHACGRTGDGRASSIGRPIANARVYILDGRGEPVPVGVAGELYAGGAGVARGYLGRPGLTAERFVPDPFSGEAGARMYRTGDLARWNADGTLEFRGRLDAQVKIRGFRIEPGEIEARLAEHPEVREAVVLAREDAPGDRRLVAYVVGGVEPDALRAHLRQGLPEHMVPAAFVVLESLPLTPNGKVDRKALPAPDLASAKAYVAPRTPVEEVLAEIWAEVLRIERVGVHESFFALGGHSLLATGVAARIRAVFGVELPPRALFEHTTVAELAGRVEETRRADLPVLPPVVPVDRTGPLPLSFAQERLWFIDRLEPGSSTYNLPVAWRLGGALDDAALERALGEIVRRHESLRTVFAEVDGAPVQVIAPFGGFTLPVEDLSALGEGDRQAAVRRRVREEAGRAFDLSAGPLFRAALLRVDEEDHVLVLTMHHVVSDGWSMGVLFRELSALYAAYLAGGESPLPALPVQYGDYAVWQREQLAGETLDRQLAYWTERLAGAPELLELPTDRSRPPARTYQGASVPVELSLDLLERLQALGRSEGATLYMTLLSAFQVLLSKYGAGDDIVVGSPIAGRTRREVEELIGFFVNTLVLRTDLSGDLSFRETLRRVRAVTLGAYEHQEVPFERLVAELRPERSMSHSPLFQVMFTLQTAEGEGGALPGLSVSGAGADLEGAKFDLSLSLAASASGLRGTLTYTTDLFEPDTVERMVGHLERVLEQVAADADARLSRLELLSEAERSTVVEAWNRTAAEYPADRCIHERFEEQAERTPAAEAVVYEGRVLSYAALNARANRLAHHLRALGVGPDARVGLCLERGVDAIVGLLGALKAGGAYVPLDPSYPVERLREMLADSRPVVLLTQASLRERVGSLGVPAVALDADAGAWAERPETNPAGLGLTPEHLAYVIYTSGSTGRPKGVMVRHGSVVNLASALQARIYAEHPSPLRVGVNAPLVFDGSVKQIVQLAAGHALCLVPEAVRRDPAALVAWLGHERVDVLDVTPSLLRLALAEGLGRDGFPRLVLVGGEAVDEELRGRMSAVSTRFHNVYGPTECTVDATTREIGGAGPAADIGGPLPNVAAYVLDPARQPVPIGIPGELYVGGAGLARGYLGRPGMTAERFVPDPFGGTPGARLYRTGDRVRWMADGTLEYLGRLDVQVKVRGFRIELGEIEVRLAEHPEVREAVVLAREDQPGDRRLVAYVVGGVETDALRAYLRRSLPEYMVPGAFVALKALPLTPNGKLDRRALPAPEYETVAGRYVAPRAPVEEVLAGILAEVLRLERVGVGESFFELGGHSLLATRVVSRIRELLGVELPLRALFEGPTVAELAVRVEEIRRADLPALPPVVPTGRAGALPLSFAQERLWFLDRLEPGSSTYNIPAAWRLGGALDTAALERALGEIVRRHEALRTTFAEVNGAPAQVIAPFGGFALPVEDLSGLDEADREGAVLRRAGEEARRPFDLSAGPLFRAALLRLDAEDHVLLLSMHHVVSDGWSTGVLFRELSALYPAFREGRESPLSELPVQYADYAVWQRGQLEGEVLNRQISYWKEQLAGAPELLELPTDHPRPPVQTYRGATVPVELSPELLEQLQALGRGEGATLYMVLLGAFQVLLSRYSGSEDVVVGSPIAGRTRGEVEGLIGFFVNTLALRTDLSGDPGFREVLRRVREATLGAYEHQEVPFERLVAELQPERSLSHAPLFQVMFTLQNAGGGGFALPGLRVRDVEAELASAKFDLSLVLTETAQGLRGGLNFSTDLFERSTIDRMLGHLARVLEQVAAGADVRLSRLELLGQAERALVLDAWNRTDAEYAAAACIHELFERQVERAPGATAVRFGDERLGYAELNARANRLAHELRARSVGPEVRVALCVERGPEMVAAVLAVLKAGGAYVPLDPAYPHDRLAYMLADSAPAVVLTQGPVAQALAGVLDGLGDGVPVLELDAAAPAWAEQRETNPARGGLTPEHPAYVIYTSGSTGRPKGVVVPHRGLCNVAAAQQRLFGVGPDDRVLQFASLSFDAAAFELVMALASGASLCVASRDELLPGPGLLALLRHYAVTAVTLPPSALAALPVEALPALRAITVAGEALPAELAARWGARHRLWNLYGPTEATIWSTAAECADPARKPDIGAPIANVRAYVLDAALEPLPLGVPGELYVGGAGVARGYLGRPGLTAERFVPDPFGGAPGARLYRTGDRVRRLADGRLDFIGRADHQVKVRGFRIEPGEIEARLAEHPGVREAVVLAREDAPGDTRLVAYWAGEAVEVESLRAHLRGSLPAHMVPSAFVFLAALPQTPNGKLDRKALPAPELASAETYVAPRTPVEEVLAGIWAEVLRLERVGVEEGFFELGGHSLLATRVVSRIRELLGVELPLRALFEGPTVAELAVRVEEMRRAELPALPPVVPTGRTAALPLSFAQERLWFLDRLEPGSAVYNIPVAWRLGGALDEAALERSLGEIVRRHEALRTVFAQADGSPVQVIVPFGGFALPVEDLSGLGEADREAAVLRRAGEEARRAFDLSAGPLFRAGLLRLGEEEHVLLLSVHHIVSDAWSMGVLYGELASLYEAYRDGRESPLAELAVQYADYAVWQRGQLEGEVLDRQLAYWTERLSGAPELLELPTDHPRPAVQTYRGATVPVELSMELLERLQALGRGEGATLYMVLLGAFQVLLSKYGGSEDVVVGSPVAGRTRKEVEELIGFFVNTLVLRTDLSGDPGFRAVLGRVREVTLGAYEHQDVPFERLVKELQPERSLSHSPLFQVLFTLQTADDGGTGGGLPGLRVSGAGADLEGAKFDLSLGLTATARGLRGGLTYSTDLFEPDTIERMARHLERVLQQVAADADVRLSRLDLLGQAERALVLEAWNRTGAEYPADRCIHELFEAQAARTPEAVAVVFEGAELTYAGLDERANRLARHLVRLGVGREARVGVCLERGMEMIVSLLAVLKAGGAYVPLDPAYPAERLAFTLADSGVVALLTQESLRSTLPVPDGVTVVSVDGAASGIAAERADRLARRSVPRSLAYLIYTSGSTGVPKGVAIEHESAVALLAWAADVFTAEELSGVLAATSISFDLSVFEIFLPLALGGRVIVVENALALPRSAAADQVRLVNTVPSAIAALLKSDGIPSGVRTVNLAGEPLRAGLVDALYARGGIERVYDLYGPSEDTTYSTWTLRRAGGPTTIGRPISNTRAYVLGAALLPLPAGVPGELYLGGRGLARGYLGRPGLTAEKFVPDPFSGEAGARLYRTGDRARWRRDGTLEYLGRLDAQVKVRGFRIELGEVEAALRRNPGVTDCVVLAREDAPGDRRLVAYVVGGVEPDALRAHLRQRLPEYMVPSAFVVLEALPLTPNGKVDRKALPAPDLASAETYVAPRTPVEEVLAGIWAEVLRIERVGVEESFFELGGHSLLATRVVSRIREVFGVELPLRALFEGPTVGEMAARVEEMRRADLPVLPPVVPTGRTGALPLSFAQERLWFIDRLEPGSALYNIPVAWRLGGALDGAALERALGEIVRRHESLRTVFAEANGSPVQVIAPFGGFTLPVEDLSSEADREAAVRRRVGEEARRAFDLAAGPLFRAVLLRVDAEEHVLLLSMHHIVSDGWSMGVLFRELSSLYAAYLAGGESPLPALAVQYADYAVWQRKQLAGETLDRQLAYWRERLAGAPELLELPTDRPRPTVRTYQGAAVPVHFSPELLERLQALGRSEGATLYMTLLGAFQVLLSKYGAGEDIVVGSPIAGRTRREVEELIGFFVNTLVLRTDLSGDPSFRETLRRVRETTLGAYEHQEVPFEKLVAELQPERSMSHSPLFQVMFTLQNADDGGTGGALAGLSVSGAGADLEGAKFDLSLSLAATASGLRGTLTYGTDLFEPDTIERMVRHLERVLEQVAADADARLSRLQLLGGAERALVLEAWNRAEAEYPAEDCIHELFEAQAARTPEAVAVRFEDESLTYAQLNARANRLAHHLRRRGVGPEVRVGICLERGLEMVVAIVAVLKAGGAYVPLDPAYPAERIAYMLADSGIPVLLTQESLRGALPAREGVEVVSLDGAADRISAESAENPESVASPDTLAYVIYTSGSTGAPKGTLIEHRNVARLFSATEAWFGFGERDVWTLFHSYAFDFSVWELWGALLYGGRVVVVPYLVSRDPEAFHALVRREGVTVLNQTPSAFRQFIRVDGERGGDLALRVVVFGGEALEPASLREWVERRGAEMPRLVNMYGITETTVHVTYRPLRREDVIGGSGSPIGVRIPDLRLYVLDAAGEPVPVGVPGELYVGGAGVARGYLNRPELTAERFVRDRFGADEEGRLYRTGDRVRRLADGSLEYLGRLDEQVKIRGFRIELGEIEAALRRHAGVRDCAVVVREDAPGDRRLVTYVVGGVEPDALRAHLRQGLPEYMVPAAFVSLGHLPLTANGKLDRRALPAPELASAEETYVAPRTPAEEVLAGVWAEVLRIERVGVEDSFFELGGHSLLATRVVSRIREVFGVELPLRALFEGPTVAGLAARVEEMRRADLPVLPPVVPTGRTGALPLSFAQERLWFIDRLEPGNAVYNIPVAWRLGGALDGAALERALGEIVRRHEVLRIVFAEVNGSPVQVVVPFGGFALPVEDLSGLSEADREAAVLRRAGEEAGRAFDLAQGPLFRATLLRLGAEEHVLLLSMHHIVSDGWSMGVLFRELSALYAAHREGRESPLPALAVQYADYAVWQREQLAGEVLDRQVSYWKEQLSGAPELLELPTDRSRPTVRTYEGATVPVHFSPELLERLQALGRSEGATLYMTLLGAFQVLLSKYGAGEDIVVGSPIAGRTRGEVEALIGFFVNTLVLRTDLSGDPSFRETLRRVRETTLGAYAHQEVPFERLVEELRPERSMSHSPLFQVMFTLQNAGGGGDALPGLSVSGAGADLEGAKFDLSLTLTVTAQGLRGGLNYSTDLFERGTAERMLGHLGRVLEQVAADADARLSRLELLSEAERSMVVEAWNRTEGDFPADRCIHQLIEEQAARTPMAVAVRFEDASLRYGELNERANRLAHSLRRRGVGPEVRVGICLERSLEMVVSILAVLKAGGAYVPLDPGLPAERLAYMLDDSATPVLLTEEKLRGLLPAREGTEVLLVDGALAEGESAGNPESGATPDTLAYVIYTSGSTGRPKGVMNGHRGVVNRLWWMQSRFRLDGRDVVLQKTPFSFDVSVWEFFWPLQHGACLVMARPEGHRDPAYLGEVIERRQVTTLHFVPSMLQQFVESAAAERCVSLTRVVCSGEALAPALVEQFHERFPSHVELHNLYGPTEAAVDVSWWACERQDSVDVVPIGRPILNTRLYVLDAGLQPVPVGAPGELYIGGVQVARGYLNRPGLTASRFVPDPLGPGAGSRLYATGDRARWRTDGAIEYLGRLDDQVKIRGFRIEPGEIEAALRRHDGVRDCVVVVREDQPGDRRLVAYVVADQPDAMDVAALRAHLRQGLPEYMVPAAFVSLGHLPLTPNGKLDRKALPAPELASAETYVAPRTPAEEVLAGVWAEVLRIERVGVEESFFELGGHSLLATRVVSRIREVFGVELPLRALFEGPTVAELAVRVEEMRRADLPVLPPVVPVERTGALPLSFAQERLWFIDQLEPGSAFYNIPAARRLRGALDGAALERALGEIVRRHEALRTVFTEVDGSPAQVIAPFGGFTLPVEDLSGLSEADREAAVRRRAGEEAGRAFDLSAGPLFRATLLRLEEAEHVLLLSMHHIVSDGWSMGVLFRELSALYAAYLAGEESPLPGLPVQYADYAVWQREHLAGEVLDRQLAYWRAQLAGAPELLELPTDRPRPAVQAYRGTLEVLELPGELLERLRALGRSEGATLYMVLLGAFQVLLSRYSGSEDVVVGSPIAGRMRREVEELIGFFVNTLVLRTDLRGDPSFRAVLRRVRETALGAYAHQELPFERLVAELQPERSLSHSPLFQVLFTHQDAGDVRANLPGVRTEGVESAVETAQFDLHLAFGEGPRGLLAVLKYSTDLFERSTIVRMLGHLGQVLEEVAGNAELRLSRLRVMSAAERRRVLEAWNGTAADYPADLCVHELVEAQVERAPHAVAAVYQGEPLTYGALDARANRLAHHLRSLGVGPDARVAICVERGLEMLVGLLAILKAGGAYVPLDPAYPADRLRFMLEDSHPQVLLTHGVPAELFAGSAVPVVDLAAQAASWASRPSSNPGRAGLTPDHLCYVIYTSGSTGRPKGVAMPHRPLVNLVAWQEPDLGRTRAAVTLQFTTISFDVSFQEIFTTLATGGRLEVASEDARHDPAAILDLVEQGGVERLSLPFSMLQLVAEEAVERGAVPPALREVQTAGEALRVTDPIRRWFGALGIPLHNHYGPSETHVATSFSLEGAADGWPLLPSIGGPVANSQAYVLDARLAPVPEGVPGELYLAGVCVARGYLDRPGPTAERFMADPFASEPGARMYRTGDRVRWLPDGTLDFLGRVDHQVKIRGFRIEPGEIEAVLRRHPAVAECAVVVREDVPGEKRLVAYVVGGAGTDALREHLRGSLPDYMVPGAFVRLEALPLTPNGKLDRKALPAPEYEADAGYVAPRTPTEEVLAGIWAEVLRLERVGVHDNFFDLGGHSLLATRMVSRIRAVLSAELPLRALFEGPTVAELSLRVEEMRRADVPLLPPVVRRSRASDPLDSISTLDELSDDELDLLLSTQS